MSKYINDIFNLQYENIQNMRIPIKLYRYTIEKVIVEHKGKCIILSSTHPQTKAKIAIKCIPIQFVQEEGKEARIMKLLHHPNIIEILDSFIYPEENPRFFAIVMPRAVNDLTHYLLANFPFEERLIC